MSQIRLSKLQEGEIRLAFFAWEDISKLEVQPYSSLLKFVWDSARQEIASFYDCVGEDFQEIADAFKTFELTMYPRISIGFDAERNTLILNIWSWMFSVFSRQSIDVGFALSFIKAGELFHEFQHYEYLRQNDMLGASEAESDSFRQQHGSEMEDIAFRKQIEVLERYKKVAPSETTITVFKVLEWRTEGNCRLNIKRFPKNTITIIDELIRQYEEARKTAIKDASGSKYTEESDKNDARANEEISKALNLPINLNLSKPNYKTIKMSF